jgi:hypothetical protein
VQEVGLAAGYGSTAAGSSRIIIRLNGPDCSWLWVVQGSEACVLLHVMLFLGIVNCVMQFLCLFTCSAS